MKRQRSARRLVILLGATFALTILSFLAGRLISEVQARQIEKEAKAISHNALIATEALVDIRTELRRTAFELQALSDVQSPRRDIQNLRTEVEESRRAIAQSWASYSVLPPFPGEQDLIVRNESKLHRMSASIDRVLEQLGAEDRQAALDELSLHTVPAIAQADEGIRDALDLNRREARESATRIARLARSWGLLPDVVSACLALAAAYFVIRVVRRYWALSEERSADLEHFAGRVAHDIRSPLGSVSLSVELAKRSPGLDPKARASLDRAVRTLQRVGQLVDGLLLFAVAGRSSPETDRTCVREVLDGIVEDLLPDAEKKDIKIDYESPSADFIAACSPGVLVSMTLNLVGNAIKYMGDSPVRAVILRARRVGRSVRIEVSDTGPGVPPALQKAIFLPHVRGAESTMPGLGLGLAIVRRLAEAHGGEVGLESTVRSGSRFWFELPEWEEPSGGSTRASRRLHAQAPSGGDAVPATPRR